MYKGQRYFYCESNCVVFVAVDKLTDPQTANAAKPIQSASGENEIKLGSLVYFYDDLNHKQEGIVRWIGSHESDAHIFGIELVSYHEP